jgi:hypothetical protein
MDMLKLIAKLKDLGFRSYNLSLGLDAWETKILGSQGSSTFDEPVYHIFEWKNNEEEDVQASIAIVGSSNEDGDLDFEYRIEGE